ncbi:hypothetical protein MNBD_GAMMA22-587 [hydrothermal vent metagenome]|uniref:Uncharacterized protein n=1 Tax=hydrothermal vent metagenome TaxID=652676 RepID=A0A3B0ZUZ3_9ZZZZ
MRQYWLHYLLVLLTAGLPVLAMADVYAFDPLAEYATEQVSQKSYPTDNFTDKKNLNIASKIPTEKSNFLVDDCNNCSSCFCCHFFTLSSVSFKITLDRAEKQIDDFDLSMLDNSTSPLLRPPKLNKFNFIHNI